METKLETVDTKTGEVVLSAWDIMRQQAEMFVRSGLLPQAINTPEKALVIMQKGKELNIPPMHALSSIDVILGKPATSPQLMLALARRTGELTDFKLDVNEKGATVTITRGSQSPHTTFFGVKEATDLGLINKDNYKKQFGIMCQWRAIASNLRVTFPDAISGLYSTDEMTGGDEVYSPRIVTMPKAIETTPA